MRGKNRRIRLLAEKVIFRSVPDRI
jgi:hypothetical protein